MRRVHIDGEPPADWVAEADTVTGQLRTAADEAARKAIIKANEGLWRDARIREWLRAQFNDKCWFSEARESVSAIHVDHFRPKGRIKEGVGSETYEGYWWLAFDWRNYRICGQLLNVKKGDLFPICEGQRCTPDDPVSLQLEAPILIDPLSDQARLISFEADEDGCRAIPAAGNDDQDRLRAERTIEILGLNLRDQLNRNRKDKWDQCVRHIQDYVSAQKTYGAQCLKRVVQAKAVEELDELRRYEAEFSSVADACIEREAPEALKGRLHDLHCA
jgi:hypothetical protein